MNKRQQLSKSRRWVVKIGSALLTNDGRGLDLSGALQARFALPLLALFAGGTLHAYSIAFLPPDLVSRGVALAMFFVPSTIATGLTRVVGSIFQRFQPRALVASGLALMAAG
ncbi:MAG: hypothetical protein Q7U07_02645, partial [Gammaproteobacteria bacterium]|nr:hypothetical protein [Gammaproteobacteria bacterium]